VEAQPPGTIARSKTITWCPRLANSAAVVAPPIPAPTTTIFAMDFVCYVSLHLIIMLC
jgi:hypothetical protein